ncbi:DUF3515 domain-containing protein [Streptomyces sp. NPDC021100]|uniref:DUF3515 domain-containing protein n=1 Tax=Streptomyces sp. NPDC021100 TaxID=3365114 RepID=UPI0037B3C91A
MSTVPARSARSTRTVRPVRPRRRAALSVAAALLCAAVGCSAADDAPRPAVPAPSGRQAALCRALHERLPDEVGGLKRRATDPVSDFTAAWGDGPWIELRCGVPRPEIFNDVRTQAVDIDGVKWSPERLPDGSIRCTTPLRPVYVEVTLPKEVVGDGGDMSALVDLAAAVRKAVPSDDPDDSPAPKTP